MNQVQTRTVSPLMVARNRWDEASRVTGAYKIVTAVRTRRAYSLHGKPGEVEAWAAVAEAEAQLVEAEGLELRASQEVAWEEKREAEASALVRARARARSRRG